MARSSEEGAAALVCRDGEWVSPGRPRIVRTRWRGGTAIEEDRRIRVEVVDWLTDAVVSAGSADARAAVVVETLSVLADAIEWCGPHAREREYAQLVELIHAAENFRRQLSTDQSSISTSHACPPS